MVWIRQRAQRFALGCVGCVGCVGCFAAVACSGTPLESATTSATADDDGNDDDDTSASDRTTNDPTTDPTGDPTTDPTGDPTNDATADTTASSDPDTSGPTTGGSDPTTTSAGESTGDTQGGDCHPQLNEIAMNVISDDFTFEWIAIHNPCAVQIDLDAYALGWGGESYTYGTHQLAGVIEPKSCFVLGGPDASNANYNPVFDQVADFDPDLQNGEQGEADGIGLFVGTAADITATSVPIDAVIYGPENVNDLIDETGAIGDVDVAQGSDTQTIARLPNDGPWVVHAVPTPNNCNDPAL